MQHLAPLIRDLAIVLGAGSIVALLFQKLKQPIVLGYLIAGVIIGPYTPPYHLIEDIPNIKILSELGVIFLMFSLGLEFSFHQLKKLGWGVMMVAFIEVVVMVILGYFAGFFLGWSFFTSLFLGASLAISSTTIIIKSLEELNLKGSEFARFLCGILIVEDMLGILLLAILATVVETKQVFSLSILLAAFKLVFIVGGWFVVGYFLIPRFFRRISKYANDETLILVSLALCLGLVCASAYFDYSIALGAFIMGSILAETPVRHRIEEMMHPIRHLFAAVFFVSMGMLIDPRVIFAHGLLILLVSALTIFGKFAGSALGVILAGQGVASSVRVGLSMAQIGEFAFIIVGLGMLLNVVDPLLFPVIVAVSGITTFTTPYCMRFSQYLAGRRSLE